MSSIVQSFQKRALFPHNHALPISHTVSESASSEQGLRRRLSSLSLRIHPLSSQATSWAFQRSKSVSSMGQHAGTSIMKWWEWGCSWILSRKPIFAQDLEMNEEETKVLGNHNRGSWGHVFFKVRSEIKKFMRSDKVGLPQTHRKDTDFVG